MKQIQEITDKASIGLSFVCVIHCLILPILIILSPSLAIIPSDNETFHLVILIAVIPISLIALITGFKKHKQKSILISGLVGMTILVLAVILEDVIESEYAEVILTTIGAMIMMIAHLKNYQQGIKNNQHLCDNNE